MKAVIQRVNRATIAVDGQTISHIGKGLVVYLGVAKGDNLEDGVIIANKIANMRIFEDEDSKMNISALTQGYEILLISQFTLLADTTKGNRPSFVNAEVWNEAEQLYKQVGAMIEAIGLKVSYGVFGADMIINQDNCGPVTITLDTRSNSVCNR